MKAYRRDGDYRLYITGTDYLPGGYRECEVWLGQLNDALGCEKLEGTLIKRFTTQTYKVEDEFIRIMENHKKGN